MKTVAVALTLALTVAACDEGPTEPEASLDRVKSQFAVMADITKANSAGYTTWSPDPNVAGATCPSNSEGKMGYHLLNLSLRGSAASPAAGDAVIDIMIPEMLLYEKTAAGALNLVGVEYLVFKEAWERVNGAGAAAPTVFGQPLLLGSHAFVAGGPEIPHYELHVWFYKANPLGQFYPYNPTVTC